MLVAGIVNAQRNQDFASKFMKMNKADTTIQCVTVSPKMMLQLANIHDESHNASMQQAVAKLKSARIVTADEGYFDVASELLKQNAARFSFEKEFKRDEQHWAFYKRNNKRGDTVELILLHGDSKKDRLTIVNLTGNIDDDFIRSLTQGIAAQEPATE
jgi:hypothetical protein